MAKSARAVIIPISQSGRDGRDDGRDKSPATPATTLVIACGALARELMALKHQVGWEQMTLRCLDARLHNRPEKIPALLETTIRQHQADYDQVFVAYGDCGTSGGIDAVLARTGAKRLPGPHCYSIFAGEETFVRLSEEEPGSFYLTDFLARHFKRLVIEGLQLGTYPELKATFFGNYKRLVYLSQSRDERLQVLARQAADFLGLEYMHHHTGLGNLEAALPSRLIARG